MPLGKVFFPKRSVAFERMYTSAGFEVVEKPHEADVVQFTGGREVSPRLYEQNCLYKWDLSDLTRDKEEITTYLGNLGKLLVGVGRGSHLLHVLNGGSLWQNADQHERDHEVLVESPSGGFYPCLVPSDHTQIMECDSNREHTVLAFAPTLSEKRVRVDSQGYIEEYEFKKDDVEVLLYPETRSLCFQPEPEEKEEYNQANRYFFELINELI